MRKCWVVNKEIIKSLKHISKISYGTFYFKNLVTYSMLILILFISKYSKYIIHWITILLDSLFFFILFILNLSYKYKAFLRTFPLTFY
jgi:hypothetical protein